MERSDFASRLSLALDLRNMKAADLSKQTGVSEGTISCYINGKYEAKQNRVRVFADALGVNPVWLMGYDVPMEAEKQSSASFPVSNAPSPLLTLGDPYHPKSQMPLLGRVAAGLPMFAEENIEGYIANDFTDGEIYYGLYVHGDSMTAAGIDDGDIVIVRQQPCVDENQIAVVLVNGNDATIKYFRQEGNMVILSPRSLNPSHQVQIYDRKKVPIEVIGRVVQIRKNV